MRRLMFSLALIGLSFGLAVAPGLALNAHNGHIRVVNRSGEQMEIDVYLFYMGVKSGTIERRYIGVGQTIVFNDCCYAAGTTYGIERLNPGMPGDAAAINLGTLVPRLCHDVVPFGYASVAIYKDNGHYRLDRLDSGCY